MDVDDTLLSSFLHRLKGFVAGYKRLTPERLSYSLRESHRYYGFNIRHSSFDSHVAWVGLVWDESHGARLQLDFRTNPVYASATRLAAGNLGEVHDRKQGFFPRSWLATHFEDSIDARSLMEQGLADLLDAANQGR